MSRCVRGGLISASYPKAFMNIKCGLSLRNIEAGVCNIKNQYLAVIMALKWHLSTTHSMDGARLYNLLTECISRDSIQ